MRRIEPFAPKQGAELARRRRLVSLAEDPGIVLGPESTPQRLLRHGRMGPPWGSCPRFW